MAAPDQIPRNLRSLGALPTRSSRPSANRGVQLLRVWSGPLAAVVLLGFLGVAPGDLLGPVEDFYRDTLKGISRAPH